MTESTIALIQKGYKSLQQEDHATAAECYEQLIRLYPQEPMGYIGRALQMLLRPNGCTSQELEDAVLRCKGRKCSPEMKEDFLQLINLRVGGANAPLLSYVCNSYNYEAVELLVDLGAKIDMVSAHNVTPLWFVCRKELPDQKKEDGRKIAQLLLSQGAAVDVVNDGGVALYNQRTDREIAKMIRKYYPDLDCGEAPSSNGESKGVSVACALAITGAAIGLILGTVFDKFLLGFVWGGALAAIFGFFGAQIDKIRSRKKGAVGKGIRNLLIAVVVMALFGLLLGNCVRDPNRYGYCPNCHSRMETKYIRNGQCTRCDGNDWSR